MQRRKFIKLSLVASAAVLLPSFANAANLNLSQIHFSSDTYTTNRAQTIMIFMYGGASQLAGNITNLEEIESKSQSSYDYFRSITTTANGCWQEAGGTAMETLMDSGDMTLFRCCYSEVREAAGNKAHGECTEQNQRGTFDADGGGVVANLAQILEGNGAIDENTLMPFVTMEGESNFYVEGSEPLLGYLKPVGINENFDNPYTRNVRTSRNYTQAERAIDNYNRSDEEGGFDPALSVNMDRLAQNSNEEGKMKDAFGRRAGLSDFIESIKDSTTPDLGVDAYPENDAFSNKIEAAIKLLDNNPDTKVITMGTGGLGGWDDHDDARDYVIRMERLFEALKSAMAHLRAVGKDETINIMVFGEFGRNVNLNSANGWDHGNLQNFYVLGGKKYFAHRGVVGETTVDDAGSINRLYLKPKAGTEQFEPLSIAATLYKIYGINNPEILTNGNEAVTL